MAKYRRIYISLEEERDAKAIEIINNVKPYWRKKFIADAIIAHYEMLIKATRPKAAGAPDKPFIVRDDQS
ncbi:MAG TPA: hypothetical protein VEF33_12795 [Syntrophales bacterium]|nr:hypothetical protein [Syntrophales bacterium]